MYKKHDHVMFGDMKGIVLTASGPKAEFPIQVIFAKQKVVMGFKESGYFFDFGAGPKLVPIKENAIKKGLNYVSKLLRPKAAPSSDQPQS